jgi:hypothetical protein
MLPKHAMASYPVAPQPAADLSVVRKVRRHHRSGVVLAFALVAWVTGLLAPAPASAQYFGRNKVQYKDLNFQVLKTEHFDIYFYPQGRAGVDISARLAERCGMRGCLAFLRTRCVGVSRWCSTPRIPISNRPM